MMMLHGGTSHIRAQMGHLGTKFKAQNARLRKTLAVPPLHRQITPRLRAKVPILKGWGEKTFFPWRTLTPNTRDYLTLLSDQVTFN